MAPCPICKNETTFYEQYGQWYCFTCNAYQSQIEEAMKVHQQQTPAPAAQTQAPAASVSDQEKCPNCGHDIKPGWFICPGCQAMIEPKGQEAAAAQPQAAVTQQQVPAVQQQAAVPQQQVPAVQQAPQQQINK